MRAGLGVKVGRALGIVAFLLIVSACADALERGESADAGPTSTVALERSPASTAAASTTTAATTTTSTTTTTTTTTTTLPPITVGFAGDTSFTHGLHGRDPLGDIAAELKKPDVMIVNLETTVAEPDVGRAIEKRFTFKSPPVSGQLLFDAGVDVAALANNHALDYGPEAVARTIEILKAADVATVGTGADRDEAYSALRLEVEGWDLAILSFSRVPCDSPEPGESYIEEVAWACPDFEELTLDAVAAAADADFTIVMVHWGIQRNKCPADHQFNLAAKWVGGGADAVIGSHPHVLQGVEKIEGAWVVHSTGNFAFPSARNESSYSAIFTMTITADGEELAATPIRIQQGRPVVARTSRAGILEDLTRRSFGYTFGESGAVVATPETGSC